MNCLCYYPGELDSVSLSFHDETLGDAREKQFSGVSLITTGVVEESRRKSLSEIVQEVVNENNLKTKIIPFLETKHWVGSQSANNASIRVLVDFWSSSEERELRNTATMVTALLRSVSAEVTLDLLACVYPSRVNRRMYGLLAESLHDEEFERHGMTYAPRTATIGKVFRTTTGLQHSLFSFLSV